MAAGPFLLYTANLDDLRLRDLENAALRLSLHTSAYVPNDGAGGHSVSADLAGELPTGGGYTAGGIALTGVQIVSAGAGWQLRTANAVWNPTGAGIPSWRYAVLRVLGSLWGKTNPLIGYFMGETGGDVPAAADGQTVTISMPSPCWFDVVRT